MNPYLATLWLGRPGSSVARLWIQKFVNNKQMTFLLNFVSQQFVFIFKTSGYNVKYDTLWGW